MDLPLADRLADRLGGSPARPAGPGARRRRRRTRRLLAAGLVAAAGGAAVSALAPAPPATTAVLVAARDLPAGSTVAAADVRRGDWPAGAVPGGALGSADLPGLVLASGLRAGEVLTDTRAVGPGLLAGQPPGTVAVPVTVDDPLALTGVVPGARVDVLVRSSDPVTGESTGARTLARDVAVLSLGASATASSGLLGASTATGPGTGLVVAVDSSRAADLLGAAGATSVAVRAPA